MRPRGRLACAALGAFLLACGPVPAGSMPAASASKPSGLELAPGESPNSSNGTRSTQAANAEDTGTTGLRAASSATAGAGSPIVAPPATAAAPSPPPPRAAAPSASARSRAASLYTYARQEEALGHREQAMQIYQRALEVDPSHGDARIGLGWTLYKLGRFDQSEAQFLEATRREGGRAEAWTGLGYARLQAGEFKGAEAALARARTLAPGDATAQTGMALVLMRTGRATQAEALLKQVLASHPGDEEAKAALAQAAALGPQRADRRLRVLPVRGAGAAKSLSTPVRAGARYFEIREEGSWKPLFLKGVNLGTALPGKFPSEFPEDEALYRDWIAKMRDMNANIVRVYTLLPPVFYQALASENAAHPARPVRLIQGVWTELPPRSDFDDSAWNAAYREEIARVIDAVHGNIEVAPRPGHASGLYKTDVTPWLLALLLGREWEPFAVEAYDRSAGAAPSDPPATRARFDGRYVRVSAGTRMERWIAGTLEFAAARESEMYRESRPLAFTNWPTLDPLKHPTEASRAEEDALLKKMGRPREAQDEVVYDNDAVSIDASAFGATPAYPAGLFASYHAYPYFPDFMILDPVYRQARDSAGPNAYAGYLRDLVRHHAGMPVLISEVGVPSSRGMAHSQPQGFSHGGLDEKAQAAVDARLVATVQETGCAGAIVFSWLDEWFKRNWLVADLEVPAQRNPLWFNALDPEQNFGILAADPGPGLGGIVLDGRTGDWEGIAPLYAPSGSGAIRALYATSDEAYLYLRLDVAPSASEKAMNDDPTYWIGLDTYDRGRGDTRLPGLAGAQKVPSGLEFAIRLDPRDPRILVDAPYDVGSHRNSGPYASIAGDSGQFIDIRVETRMERIGRDGTVFPAEKYDLSPLRQGTTDPLSPRYDSLADFDFNRAEGHYELRIPWNLINVTDPSSLRVVNQPSKHLPPIDTTVTDGIAIYAVAASKDEVFPSGKPPRAGESPALYTWKGWESPRYHLRLKGAYAALREAFGRLEALPAKAEAP